MMDIRFVVLDYNLYNVMYDISNLVYFGCDILYEINYLHGDS
jgi:hypothetical protein